MNVHYANFYSKIYISILVLTLLHTPHCSYMGTYLQVVFFLPHKHLPFLLCLLPLLLGYSLCILIFLVLFLICFVLFFRPSLFLVDLLLLQLELFFLFISSSNANSTSPHINSALSTLFIFAFSFASSMACSTISMP